MAGYSATSLLRKLGIKEGFRIHTVNEPADYWGWLSDLPPDTTVVGPRARTIDFVHLFTKSARELERRLPALMKRIVPNGMIWVSWPKKASNVPTDVTEDTVRRVALPMGLVDVKVCAVDDVWSGLKLVIRKKLR